MAVIERKVKAVPVDLPLTITALLLSFIGILNLASAGSTSIYWHRQLFSLFIGIVACVSISTLDYRTLNRQAYIIYGTVIFILIITVAFGTKISGTRAWLRLGLLSIQPSEFMKFSAIVAMAKYFHDQRLSGPYGLKELGVPFLIAIVPVGLIMAQPDLGTTLMLLVVLGSMILFAGVRRKLTIGAGVIILASFPLVWKLLAPHQKSRILTFLNPERDPTGAGYNVIQSMVAVGSGRLFGKGYRLGSQTALRYLPERHSDFAFSVIGEEWGFIGSLVVLLLLAFLVFWALRIAMRAKDRFGMLCAVGVSALIFWHTAINISMTLGAFPVVGIPLPFLSYGGSFLITVYASIGLLMSIEGRRFMF